jgi:hypothetical protein
MRLWCRFALSLTRDTTIVSRSLHMVLPPVLGGRKGEIVEHQGLNLRNPLFDQLARYPGQFAQPVFFADPAAEGHAAFKNGSGFFVRLPERTVGVTCHHVLADYRKRRGPSLSPSFQFGRVRFEPEERLVAEDRELDLAILDVASLVDVPDGIHGASCLVPGSWPPGDLSSDDILALGGFPGIGRQQITPDYFRFHLLSVGTTEVASLGSTHLVTRIELEKCVSSGVLPEVTEDLGGMSGGPVFVWRKGVLVSAELIGVIYEYQASLDLLYVRRLACVRPDGTLESHT